MGCLEVKIWWIMFVTICSNMAYALIAPFLPLELKAKGVTPAAEGAIFAIYSIGVIFWSPIVSTLSYGRKNIITVGMLMMGITFIAFSFLQNMKGSTAVTCYCLILRLMQGVAG